MTGRTEDGTVPFSLAVALATDTHTGDVATAIPASTLETLHASRPRTDGSQPSRSPASGRWSSGDFAASLAPSAGRRRPSAAPGTLARRPSWPSASPPISSRTSDEHAGRVTHLEGHPPTRAPGRNGR